MEFIVVKSLTLKPSEKSIRRLKLKLCKPQRLEVILPTEQDVPRLVIPETSMAGADPGNRPIFLNRFSALEKGDDLGNQSVLSTAEYKVRPQGSQKLLIERTFKPTDPLHEPVVHRTTINNTAVDSIYLTNSFTLKSEYESLLTFQNNKNKDRHHFVKVGEDTIYTESFAPRDIFCAPISRYLETKIPNLGHKNLSCLYYLLEKVALVIRFFQLYLDLSANRVYYLRNKQDPAQRQESELGLLKLRIEVLEVLIEFFQGPLSMLVEKSRCKGFDWLEKLPHRLSTLQTEFERSKCEQTNSTQVFDWQLCTQQQSGIRCWLQLYMSVSEEANKEFVIQLWQMVKSYNERVNRNATLSNQQLFYLGWRLHDQMDRWNDCLAIKHTRGPDYTSIWSVCLQRNPKPNQPRAASLLPLAPQIWSHANSAILPPKARSTLHHLQLARGAFLIDAKCKKTEWSFEVFTSQKPSHSKHYERFRLAENGIWEFAGSISWPKIPDPKQLEPSHMEEELQDNPAEDAEAAADEEHDPDDAIVNLAEVQKKLFENWYCYMVEFTLTRVFLLCAKREELYLLTFEPFSMAANKCCTYTRLHNPMIDFTHATYSQSTRFFYENLHEPHRSDTFKWIHTDKQLLWACPAFLHREPGDMDRFVQVFLVLKSFTLSNGVLYPKTSQKFHCGREWLTILASRAGRVERDSQRNQNLCFYFSWREAAGRVIGIWLRRNGTYQIYAQTRNGFVFCADKAYGTFADYYMTELLSATPGLVGNLPIMLRKNHSIRLTNESFSFELVELKVHLS